MEPLDESAVSTLTVQYQYNGKPIPGAEFELFRVAERTNIYSFEALEPFDGCSGVPEKIGAGEWNELAELCRTFARTEGLSPDKKGETDANGIVSFTGLDPALYLVAGKHCTVDGTTYAVSPYMVALPALEDDVWSCDVLSSPKSVTVDEKRISQKVLIIWEDEGFEDKRPPEVTVTLFKDGEPYSVRSISEEDDWSYTWDDLNTVVEWSISEIVPDGYTVTYGKSGITFTVTNKKEPTPTPTPAPNPSPTPTPVLPQTGQLWWPVPLLTAAGLLFIVIGLAMRRSGRHE